MSFKRLALVCRNELSQNVRRPLFWVLILLVVLLTYGFAQGNVRLATGDDTIGGQKPWITSEFANAQMLCLVIFLLYTFFVAVAAGMGIINDDELKVGEILHVTSLRPAEYVWGKFLGVLLCFLFILAFHVLAMIFFNQFFPNAKADEIRGPFKLANYLRPVFYFTLPLLIFLAGIAFAAGEWTRRPILVFVLPVVIFLVCGFFLWGWEPSWLDPRIDQVLMQIDPSGFRWLRHTWLKVDRGVEFYNKGSIVFDPPFLVSRLVLVFIGLASVWLCQLHLARNLRGARSAVGGWVSALFAYRSSRILGASSSGLVQKRPGRLSDLRMQACPPGFWRGVYHVARIELRELRSQPGLYIIVPMI